MSKQRLPVCKVITQNETHVFRCVSFHDRFKRHPGDLDFIVKQWSSQGQTVNAVDDTNTMKPIGLKMWAKEPFRYRLSTDYGIDGETTQCAVDTASEFSDVATLTDAAYIIYTTTYPCVEWVKVQDPISVTITTAASDSVWGRWLYRLEFVDR